MSEETKQSLVWGGALTAVLISAMVFSKGCYDSNETTKRIRDQAIVECSKHHPPLECKAAMWELAR